MDKKENVIMAKSFQFAVGVIRFCEELERERKFVIANQLLKSGTSIGAQVREAQNAESKADFIHKFKIAAKEVEETEYWLMLIEALPTRMRKPISFYFSWQKLKRSFPRLL
jgi:four helix bundle protein